MLPGSASTRTSPAHLQHHYTNASAPAVATVFPLSEPYPAASWTPSYPHAMSPTIPVPSNEEYTSYFPSPAAAHEISDESYVMYYFESVRKEQFVFASNSLTNTLYSVRLLPRSHFRISQILTPRASADRTRRSKRPGRQCYLCSI